MQKLQHHFGLSLLLLCIIAFSLPTEVGVVVNAEEIHIASSCTIFTVTIGDKVYFCNNEDYMYTNFYRWYMPAQNV